jgi:hypothetical protein
VKQNAKCLSEGQFYLTPAQNEALFSQDSSSSVLNPFARKWRAS